jgi:hypothetical protein
MSGFVERTGFSRRRAGTENSLWDCFPGECGSCKKGHAVLRGPKAVKFAVLDDYRGLLSKAHACRVMGVTDRGLRAWKHRPVSHRRRRDMVLLAHIRDQHRSSLGSYGRPRMTEELNELGIDRSTLADWVGKATALLAPLADAIGRHVLAGQAIFADDTPVAMLAPGTGKTQTARLWAYGRDERPWGSAIPPARLAARHCS